MRINSILSLLSAHFTIFMAERRKSIKKLTHFKKVSIERETLWLF